MYLPVAAGGKAMLPLAWLAAFPPATSSYYYIIIGQNLLFGAYLPRCEYTLQLTSASALIRPGWRDDKAV